MTIAKSLIVVLWKTQVKWGGGVLISMRVFGHLCVQTIDLLDIILALSFTLLTSGAYMLWGKGWACIMLGSLLLSLVVIGIPTKQKS
jgi:hypothetical protein